MKHFEVANLESFSMHDSEFSLLLNYVAFLFFGNTFQNLRVSSPAPVTIVSESGDIAR